MHDRTARLMCVLGLTPLTCAIFTAALFLGSGRGVEMRAVTAGCTLLLTIALVLLWRRYVAWTTRRGAGVATLTAALLVHSLLWIPIYDVECIDRDIVCLGQSSSLSGVWAILVCLLWWGGAWRATRPGGEIPRRNRMTPESVRMALSFALIPLLPGVSAVSYYFLRANGIQTTGEIELAFSYAVSALLAVAAWLLIWRRCVNWRQKSPLAVGALAVILVGACGSPLLPAFVAPTPNAISDLWDSVRMLAPVFALALWIGGTSWLWRDAAPVALAGAIATDAVDELARCPKCAYSLKGLGVIRCPECGWTDTVDGVIARSLNVATNS